MKHEIIIIMASLLCGLSIFPSPAQAKYGGGTGEPNDPFLIYTAEQMNAIGADSNDWDKHFKLMADIDLGQYDGKEGREVFNIIGVVYDNPFNGVFDGNGHTILNFTYDSNDRDYIGLFGYVYGGDIKNLGLINPNVDAGTSDYVSALVGGLYDGKITDCYVEGGSVSGNYCVGGLVGGNGRCSVLSGCYWGTISNCYSTSSVSGLGGIGGLTGVNYGTISCCYSTGDVEGDERVGGLVGCNGGKITNSYASGGVSANGEVGGLVGRNGWYLPVIVVNFGTIYNCYSTGSVIGTSAVGGLLGYNEYGEVLNSFWDTETSGLNWSDGGTGKTSDEMQTMSMFADADWGCELVWTIDDSVDYPRLVWENAPGEPITTPSYGGGTGKPNDPFLIYTAEQLNTIGLIPCHWDKCFKLMADIDLGQFMGM